MIARTDSTPERAIKFICPSSAASETEAVSGCRTVPKKPNGTLRFAA